MLSDPPKFENAPGLKVRRRKQGWEVRWKARSDLIKRGWSPKSRWLWYGTEPSEVTRQWVSDQCNLLQNEMLNWGRGGVPAVFDGKLRSLIRTFQTDKVSKYHTIRYRTRLNYESLMARLEKDFGDQSLFEIKARDILIWHDQWTRASGVTRAHGLINMLRTVCGFGATFLEDEKGQQDCERLCGMLHRMKFEQGGARKERLTSNQADAIRAKAHEMGLHSVALAQAFQFEGTLRQKDVIGEWVPQSEPGTSDVLCGDWKWIRGLRWSEIDDNLILTHVTSKKGKEIVVDLHNAPMVLEELARFDVIPRQGPIIISEDTKQPYFDHNFRYHWRKLARACGIPDEVFNMDTRAGAISEATDAGANLEDVRHAATHSDISMTQRYSRGSVEKVANVMKLRAAHRNKSGTK